MRKIIFLLFVGFAICLSSCRQDFVFEPSTGDLFFSKDTVYLDTVFTNIGSSTYTLKVYNRSDKDIKIPTIQLAKGQLSKYRMTVDGMTGDNNRIFHDVELLAKDSMYIFIETTAGIADANPDDFLYTDQIQFDSGANFQKVELVTLIQDAYFIFPNKENGIIEQIPIGTDEDGNVIETNGRNLSHSHPDNGDEYTFQTDKPYVVYGYASVPNNETLTIPAGARVHFHADSGIVVQQGGTLHVEGTQSTTGTLDHEVVFEGDRLEPDFSDVPGQWGTIYLRGGSGTNTHSIKNLTIKNAVVGLLVEDNVGTTSIENLQVYDCSNYGIFSSHGSINGKNIVVNTCGQFCFAAVYGGTNNFTNCTFNNNWSSSKQLAVYLSDYFADTDTNFFPLTANFTNCIIYGSNSNELIMNKKGTVFNATYQNCLVKLNVSSGSAIPGNPLYDVLRLEQNGNIINDNPKFLDIPKNKLFIGADSPAKGTGIDGGVALDILGNPRGPSYDIGAYNWITFPEPN